MFKNFIPSTSLISLLLRFSLAVVVANMLVCGQLCSAQFYDDFSDGDLTNGVMWSGDVADYIVSNGELQLQAPAAGSSSLSAGYTAGDSLRLGAYIRLDFPPSADNRLRLYLFRESMSPDSGRALILDLGESGSNDAFELTYRDSSLQETVFTRFDMMPQSGMMEFLLQVERYTEEDPWIFSIDHEADGTIDQTHEIDALPSLYSPGYFGLTCYYTSSRTDKFFFDDVFVEQIVPDRQPPAIVSVEATELDQIQIYFDEPIDGESLTTDQFFIDPGGLSVIQTGWSQSDPQLVRLTLSQPLISLREYWLELTDIYDIYGNTLDTARIPFTVLISEVPGEGDVIINEIHAAPSDRTVLPEAEFVELLNRSDKVINLSLLTFSDAGSTVQLPDYFLLPGAYAVLVDPEFAPLFENLDTLVSVFNFPGLNNSSDELQLRYEEMVIDRVHYSSDWYDDSDKLSGWSLECVNEESLCRGRVNWTASIEPTGGTPGEVNSVFSAMESHVMPAIQRVSILAADRIEVTFTIEMDTTTLTGSTVYNIQPALDVVGVDVSTSEDKMSVILMFSDDLQPGLIYEIGLTSDVRGCNGVAADGTMEYFGIPQPAEPGDIRISEILYQPYTGESEFIELANTSDKLIDLSTLWLEIFGSTGSGTQSPVDISGLMSPGTYTVLTDAPQSVSSIYEVPFPSRNRMYDLPSLTNSGGRINVFVFDEDLDTVVVDRAVYGPDFHDPLINESTGISLERVVLDSDGTLEWNWYSASTLAGGATPTGENSQQIIRPENDEERFFLSSPTFSPDGDGFEDFMTLNYSLEEPGYIANVKILSHDGVLIKTLVSNQSLGNTGQLTWNGDTDDGDAARVGIYYVLIKAFSPQGNTLQEKRKIVLARML